MVGAKGKRRDDLESPGQTRTLAKVSLRHLLSHCAAIAFGGGLWIALRPTHPAPSPVIVEDCPSRYNESILRDEVQQRLDDLLAKANQDREESEIPFQEIIERRRLQLPAIKDQKLTTLTRLHELAKTFRNSTDLGKDIYAALASEDRDKALAIFLEWQRRNPTEAWRELGLRREWMQMLWTEPAVMLALSPQDILTGLKNFPGAEIAIEGPIAPFAAHLAEYDDLAGLRDVWDGLSPSMRESLLSSFLNSWVPLNGAISASFIKEKMSPELRQEFMASLVKTEPRRWAWTEDFSSALLSPPLGDIGSFRRAIRESTALGEKPLGSSAVVHRGRVVIPLYRRLDREKERQAEKLPEDVAAAAQIDAGAFVERHRFGELLASKKTTISQIREKMIAAVPAIAGHPQTLDLILFEDLFIHSPEEVAEWAKKRLSPRELQQCYHGMFERLDEPRSARLALFRRTLPEESLEGSSILEEWNESIANWRTYRDKTEKEEAR